MKVYKYRGGNENTFERDVESIRKNYFWAAKFQNLNDPCEGLFNRSGNDLSGEKIKELIGSNVDKGIEAYIDLLNIHKEFGGVFSLSKTNTDELLWAHYGSSHTGFCIEYDLEKLKNDFHGYEAFGFDVKYTSTPPEVKFIDAFSAKRDKLVDIKRVLGHKSSRWKYEEEYRIVTNISGMYPYDFEALTGIYFGLRMKDENKERIRRILIGRGVNFYQIILKENSYELDYVQLGKGAKSEITYQKVVPNTRINGAPVTYKIEKRFSRTNSVGFIKIKLDQVLKEKEVLILCNLVQEEIFPFAKEIKVDFFEDGVSKCFAESYFKNNEWSTKFNSGLVSKENYNINDYRIFPDQTLEEKFVLELSRLRGAGSIKKASLKNNTAFIEYVRNYEEFKKLQPQSNITKEQLDLYWNQGDTVLKAINEGSVRLMKKIDQINEVIIEIPYKENIYTIHVKKSDVEDFLGFSFKEIRLDWDNTFSKKYVYTKEGRIEFFEAFGSITKDERFE